MLWKGRIKICAALWIQWPDVSCLRFFIFLFFLLVNRAAVLAETAAPVPISVGAVRWDGGPLEFKRLQAMELAPASHTKLVEAIRDWYSPATVDYVTQAHFNEVWLTWSVGFSPEEEEKESAPVRQYIRLCRQRSLQVMGLVWVGQVLGSPEMARDSKRVLRNPQGLPLPCQGKTLVSVPGSGCFQANLNEPEWRGQVIARCIRAIEAGVAGVVLDGLSTAPIDQVSVAEFVRDITRGVKSSWPSASVVPLLSGEQLAVSPQSPVLAVNNGVWPGVSPTAVTVENGQVMIAGASQGPWIDLNTWLFNYAASVSSGRPVVLVYPSGTDARDGEIKVLPAGSHALAIAESNVSGGACVLGLDDGLRLGLFEQDPRARREWDLAAQYQSFFRTHSQYLQLPPLSNVAVIIESIAEAGELLNLLARRGVQYQVLGTSDLSTINLKSFNLVACVNVGKLGADKFQNLIEYVKAGGTAVTNPPNVPEIRSRDASSTAKQAGECTEYPMGKGKWIVYGDAISDPDQFSREVRSAVPFTDRWVRLWNAPTVSARTAQVPNSRKRIVHLVNYGIEPIDELQIQVKGSFTRVQVLSPDYPEASGPNDLNLTLVNKAGFTEFLLPSLGIYSLVLLE
jgi:hypothetical protein